MKNTALVVGDTGIIGSHIVAAACAAHTDWDVYGLSRHSQRRGRISADRRIVADLLVPQSLVSELRKINGVTHLFYAARSPQYDAQIEADRNGLMFKNVLNAVAETQENLCHVNLMEGMKWYGSHLGKWKTPARESDRRASPPNMYYTQQDELERQRAHAKWTWSALRPHQIAGFASHYPHNLAAVIAVYGTICRESGLPLHFPGSRDCFDSISMITDAQLLANAALWVSSSDQCRDRAFNITNGDVFRWSNLWPELAEFFGTTAGEVRPMSLVEFMQDKEPVWRTVQKRHGLRDLRFAEIVNWEYGDFSFRADCDDIASTIELRQAGFDGCRDSHRCLLDVLTKYRTERVIP